MVGGVLLGALAVGCGQVTDASAGAGTGGLGNARSEPVNPGDSRLPAVTDRFAFAKSGQRVHALGYASEGVTQFRTLHDQQLDFDCEFMSGAGSCDLHCVPKQAAELIFLDANCSQPATWNLFQAAHVGDWVSVIQVLHECPGQGFPRQTFKIAEEVYPEASHGPGPAVYELQGTSCVAAYPPAKSIPAVNRLIPHADRELVAARPVSFDVGGGLRLSRLLGEDGSELTVAVTNAAGEACSVQSDGQCVPSHARASGPIPTTQRIRQGSGAVHVDLFSSLPGAGREGVPVAHFPDVLDFMDDSGDRCQVLPAVDGTLRCASLDPDGHYGASAYESPYYADAACSQQLRFGYPLGVDFSRLRVALYSESNALTAISTVKVYEGPVYHFSDELCVSSMTDGTEGELLTLDRRIEASDMPLVVETTL